MRTRMIERVKQLRSGERGWVLVIAMAVMAIMLVVGIGVLKLVDTQANVGGAERIRESSFDAAEGLLYSESAVLQKAWPRTPVQAYIPTCDQTNYATNTDQCPDAAKLFGSGQIFNNQDDNKPGLTWRIQVRDDVGASQANPNPIYVAGTAAGQVDSTLNGCTDANGNNAICTYDANGDKKLWVRAEAFVNGKTRMLVALLQLESFRLPFAKNAVVGGSLTVSNQGNKTVVDTTGSQVVVRCSPSPNTTLAAAAAQNATSITVASNTGFANDQTISIDTGTSYETINTAKNNAVSGTTINLASGLALAHSSGVQVSLAPQGSNSCENWLPNKSQVSPGSNYSSQTSYPPGLSPGQLAAIEASADCVYSGTGTSTAPVGACGSTTAACPPQTNAGWTGKIVIKGPAQCTMNPPNNTDINSETNPGFVVVENGTLDIEANSNYYGVIYMANQQNATNDPSNPVVKINGTGSVIGGVAVDGNGAVVLGQNLAVRFDANAFISFSAAGAAGLVQNTWRELGPGQ
jgi:hypothetical protein